MTTISIITVSRNSATTLEQCIQSVAQQDQDVEHILIDGASTDRTPEIIDRYRSQLAKVVSEPDHGIYDAMNKGIGMAAGEVVGSLNADDYYPESDVLTSVRCAFEDPQVDACYGDLRYVEAHDPTCTVRLWRAGRYDARRFYQGWMPPHPTFFVKRHALLEFGNFNTDLGSAADYELMLRLLLRCGLSAVYVPRVLVHMRTGGASNASLGARLRANRMDRRAWEVNNLKPRPWTLLAKPLRKLPQWWVR